MRRCIVVAALTSAVADDRERHRYRLFHRLVRADGLGEWTQTLDDVLTGPAAQFLDSEAAIERKQLTQRCGTGEWQHSATQSMIRCLDGLGIEHDSLGPKLSCKQSLDLFVQLRNKTRAHGAKRSGALGSACKDLEASLSQIVDNLVLFKRPWVYLKQNLSGKYRVTVLSSSDIYFDTLKNKTDLNLEEGVYVKFEDPFRIDLLVSDPDASDFFLPNGGFNDHSYELLSYSSGDTQAASSRPYLTPANQLPASETEGLVNLDVIDNVFANLPPLLPDYVNRKTLEDELIEQLLADRHPIITMSGSGGIGKTSLALHVLHGLAGGDNPKFQVILWFSARDIDLLPQGPRTVRAGGITLNDFARRCCELLETNKSGTKGKQSLEQFAKELTHGTHGATLFVFDNFETVRNPGEIYAWIDSYIRAPNKVLITTRIRGDFFADYPLQVNGMTDEESDRLIDNNARSLKIGEILTTEYKQEIIDESDGHPYVIKVLLGEVAKAGRRQKVERIVARHDEILTALFERTYASLAPAAQRVFLTLANWRSTVPELAVHSVLMRPGNELIDVEHAIEELLQSSFVEEYRSDEGDRYIRVPLAASIFGSRKLAASSWKVSVEADTELLQAFGAAQEPDVKHGIAQQVGRLFNHIARQISRGSQNLDYIVPVLEFVCRQFPGGWLLMADLYTEIDSDRYVENIKRCLQSYLESDRSSGEASWAWKRLADVCCDSNDFIGELNALSELCKLTEVPLSVVSSAANRINQRLSEVNPETKQLLGSVEKRRLLQPLLSRLECDFTLLDGIGCSRFAWLYLHVGEETKARAVATSGWERDPADLHCSRLLERLNKGNGSSQVKPGVSA